MKTVRIGGRDVGHGHPVYVIAEVSANHNGSLSVAKEVIDAAAEAGADAVKFQTYTADTITFKSDAEPFQVRQGTLWDGRTLHDLYTEGQMPWEWHEELFAHAADRGLHAFSSPFDPTAVDYLAALDVPAFKIASFEITDVPLIRHTASKGRPVIISTGIATRADIERAVEACRSVGNDDIVLLKCTSIYPAPAEELNLSLIPELRRIFDCVVGFSDHTMTPTASVASVALGAHVIERHIATEAADGGLDSAFSTSPTAFAELVAAIREAETALGRPTFDQSAATVANRTFARSLFVVSDVTAGDVVTSANVRSIRPSHGLPPRLWDTVEGRTFLADVAAGTPLTAEHLGLDASLAE